jgi:WD40 repeat protein
MQRFQEPIQWSAAHVYVSAIPLTPSSSIIFKVYAPHLKRIPKLVSGNATPSPWTDIRRGQTVVSYSLDRSWLVFAGFNNTLEIWDTASCSPLCAPLTGHGAEIRTITFSHDGTKFCSADRNNCIRVWDTTTYDAIGVPIQVPHFGSRKMWYLPDSALDVGLWTDKVIIYDGIRHRVSLWDIATGISVADHELECSPDSFTDVDLQGAYLVMQNDDYIASIVYTITGEDVTEKYTRGRDIMDVRFSLDNKVVCLYYTDGGVSILDVRSGNLNADLDVDIDFLCRPVPFSPNGQRILVVTSTRIAIHDLDAGKLVYGPFETTYTIEGAELSLDETHLLVWNSRSFDVFDIPSSIVIASSKLRPSVYGIVISSNGNRVVMSSPDTITIFDVLSLSSHSYDIGIASVAPSPNGRQLLFAMSDNTLRFSMDISFTNSIVLDGARSPAAFAPEGSTIASAYMDHTLQLWDTKDAKAIGNPLGGHRRVVTAIAFSPTGSRLISASDDNTIRIWNLAAGGEELLRLQAYSDIWSISLSSDESRIICASEHGIIHTLDASTGFPIRQPSPSEWRWAELLPGAKEVFYVSADGQTRLVECQSGRVTERSTSLSRRIANAVFSPQRTHFISISETYLIDFSDITASDEPSSTASLHRFPQLTFSSNGRWLMSVISTSVYHVYMWDSKSGQLLWEDLSDGNRAPIVAFSHSGNMAVIWSPSVCCIRDTLFGTIVSCWRTKSAAQVVTFSPDEKQIICILEQSDTSETWDIECGTRVDSLQVEPVSRRIWYKNTLESDL